MKIVKEGWECVDGMRREATRMDERRNKLRSGKTKDYLLIEREKSEYEQGEEMCSGRTEKIKEERRANGGMWKTENERKHYQLMYLCTATTHSSPPPLTDNGMARTPIHSHPLGCADSVTPSLLDLVGSEVFEESVG